MVSSRDEYYELHKCCPYCGNDRLCQTLLGFVFNPEKSEAYRDRNTAKCKCGWTGTVHALVPKKEDTNDTDRS